MVRSDTYFLNQRRWAEAEQLEVQVMETSKTVLGPEHPSTLNSMWNLSHTLKDLGQYLKALSMLEICVRLQKQRLGLSHLHIIFAGLRCPLFSRSKKPDWVTR